MSYAMGKVQLAIRDLCKLAPRYQVGIQPHMYLIKSGYSLTRENSPALQHIIDVLNHDPLAEIL